MLLLSRTFKQAVSSRVATGFSPEPLQGNNFGQAPLGDAAEAMGNAVASGREATPVIPINFKELVVLARRGIAIGVGRIH